MCNVLKACFFFQFKSGPNVGGLTENIRVTARCTYNMRPFLHASAALSSAERIVSFNTNLFSFIRQIYNKFTDEVTVYMGPENGRRFFTVDKYHGKPNLGIWDDAKCDSVQGATEGVTYHQFVSKNDTLKYLRKTMCRVTPLKYKSAYKTDSCWTLGF